MPEVAGVRDRRAFLIFVGMQVAAWSVPASATPIHSANAGEPRLFLTPMERDMSGSERPDFNDALAVGRAFDLTLPDSHAVRDAYAQGQDHVEAPPLQPVRHLERARDAVSAWRHRATSAPHG